MCLEFKLLIIHGTLCDGDMMMGLMVVGWIAVAVAFAYDKYIDDEDDD